MKNKSKIDILTGKQRKAAIKEIIDFFATERGEEIGVIAAEDILDMILRNVGAEIYNKGVDDAKDLMESSLQEVGTEMEVSLKRIVEKRRQQEK